VAHRLLAEVIPQDPAILAVAEELRTNYRKSAGCDCIRFSASMPGANKTKRELFSEPESRRLLTIRMFRRLWRIFTSGSLAGRILAQKPRDFFHLSRCQPELAGPDNPIHLLRGT
jgi:hypothetical protein